MHHLPPSHSPHPSLSIPRHNNVLDFPYFFPPRFFRTEAGLGVPSFSPPPSFSSVRFRRIPWSFSSIGSNQSHFSRSHTSRLCAGDPRQQNHIHNGKACVIRRRAAAGLGWLGPFIPLHTGFGVRVWTQAVSGVPSILIHDLARREPRLFGD